MEKRYIIGLDEGTTSCRCVVFDTKQNKIVFINKKRFKQYFPKPGWVEHNANEIWANIQALLNEAIDSLKLTNKNTYGIGITNQRESVVAWDKRTGKAVCMSIVWQCRRTANFCDGISKRNRNIIQKKTGLIVDAYFSASKFKWMLENEPECKKLLSENNLCIGTIDSFLVYNLTNGKSFVTDTTNVSRTMLYNIDKLEYDEWLLKFFNIPKDILPKVVNSNECVGVYKYNNNEFKICGIIGDQQSSLFGQACFNHGMAKCTYGTGCFILSNTGETRINSKKMLSTIAWTINGKTTYAMEGSVFNAGSAVDWIVDDLQLVKTPKEVDELAVQLKNNEGVYFVPAFTGIGAPYWNQYCTGLLTGLTRGSDRRHIARAVLESMAYNINDIANYMYNHGVKVRELRVDGGVAKSDFLMQFQSNILNTPIILPESNEATVLGCIYMAGLGLGAYKNLDEIQKCVKYTKTYSPKISGVERKLLCLGWQKAVQKCLYREEE